MLDLVASDVKSWSKVTMIRARRSTRVPRDGDIWSICCELMITIFIEDDGGGERHDRRCQGRQRTLRSRGPRAVRSPPRLSHHRVADKPKPEGAVALSQQYP